MLAGGLWPWPVKRRLLATRRRRPGVWHAPRLQMTMAGSPNMSRRKGARGFMVLTGLWLVCDDGITRPVIRAKILGGDGVHHPENFLVDSGADRTVLSAALLGKLGFSADQANPKFTLQ